MTGTLISLISILVGIIAAHLFGKIYKKYTFGFKGNTLIGVFGSILFIKTFGRLGFNPWSIMNDINFNGFLLVINLLVSALGAVFLLIIIKMGSNKINKNRTD